MKAIISISLLLLAIPGPILAKVGGPCSGDWNAGGYCICEDPKVCKTYGSGAEWEEGTKGHWPCPNDPDNIWACAVNPCKGQGLGWACKWRNTCASGKFKT